jgi:hypothetical protein
VTSDKNFAKRYPNKKKLYSGVKQQQHMSATSTTIIITMTRGGPPPTQTHPPYGTMMVVLLVSSSAVVYSHCAQRRDQAMMRAGVERDKERLRITRQRQAQQQE